MANWHIITSEYPPQLGGVSDYVREVAVALAGRGHAVHVWAPRDDAPREPTPGVEVHEELGTFARSDLRRVSAAMNAHPAPRRLFVQWVPHGFGYRSMNIGFCLWVLRRSRVEGDTVDIMVHEAFLSFRKGAWKENAAAVVHRLMTIILLRAATRVRYTIPAWERLWRKYTLGRAVPFAWLPMPSTVPIECDPERIAAARARFATAGGGLIGHFGTFGRDLTDLVVRILAAIPADAPAFDVLLMGPRGEIARNALIERRPDLAGRVHVTGPLRPAEIPPYIGACDVMLQPYTDGVTTRRTSFMAGLALGRPIVTTLGFASEPFWRETRAARFGDPADAAGLGRAVAELLSDPGERARLGRAARSLYAERFDIRHGIESLDAA